jgi:hypothetical protein
MPISAYDDLFGGDANKTYQALLKQYGDQKGKSVFYAMVNKRRRARSGKKG